MMENAAGWGIGMTLLAVVAVLLIFLPALYWVNSIRKGNRRLRFWQKRHPGEPSPEPAERSYPGTRDDLK